MVGSEDLCIFSSLVTGDEWKVISIEIANIIESFFTKKVPELITSKALLETNCYNADQGLSQVREELEKVSEENDSLRARIEVSTSTITILEKQISKLQTTCRKLEEDVAEFRHQRNLAVDERDEHLKMLQRRNIEIERMRADLNLLTEQLETAINKKCEALAKADAVESMKLTLKYGEKRIEHERGLLNSQVESLTQELHLKNEELLNIRRDNISRCIQLETKLTEKTQELEVAVDQIKSITELNNNLTARSEELVQNLANQRDTEGKLIESYLQEIDANTKLANAHQQMYEESKQHAEALKEALDEIQELLKNATHKYGELEAKHKGSELAHEEIITEKNEYIAKLKAELESANELLGNSKQSKQHKDKEDICPTAAQTSNLRKTGMTFTELYSKYVSMSDEIINLKEEKVSLNNYISNIVKEIEDKGPSIKKLKDDYATIVGLNDECILQNDALLMEIQQLKEKNTEYKRLENATTKENAKLQKDITDLSQQVCHLLQEVELSRLESSATSCKMDFTDIVSSADITKKLVTFDDIQDLQQNNKKLLSLVGELTEKQEKSESSDPIVIAELDTMREQLQELLVEKEKQNQIVETLKNQRDIYKNLYSGGVKGSDEDVSFNMQENVDSNKTNNNSMSDSHHWDEKDLEKQIQNLKKQIEKMKKENDTYREEKLAKENILEEQNESLRKENKDLMTLNCKLVGHSEMNDEKFKIMKNNMEVLNKQVTALERQNKISSDTILKHEQTMSYLRDDALQAHSKLSKSELMLANLEKENSLLKDSESRIRKEYESLVQQTRSLHLIHSNIELIKATLERKDSVGKLRLEARLDEGYRNCSVLRKRLQEEYDQFRQLSDHLQNPTQNAVNRCEEEKAEAQELRKELSEVREELGSKNSQIDEHSKKIGSSNLAISESHEKGNNIRRLEKQFDKSQAEIETLKAKPKSAEEASDQYLKITEIAEEQMQLAIDQQEELETELGKNVNTVRQLQKKCSELEGELPIQMVNLDMPSVRNMTRNTQIQEELHFKTLDSKSSRGQLGNGRSECKSLIENLKTVGNENTREVILHSSDLRTLKEMKEAVNLIRNDQSDIKKAPDYAISELGTSKDSWKTQEEHIKDESVLETRPKVLDAQNGVLLSRMETLNSQLAILQMRVTSENANQSMLNFSSSFNEWFTDGELKSSEELFKVIKYLRQEKDFAVSKSEILEVEHSRVKSELELVTTQLEEMKGVVENYRQKSEGSEVTVAKHAEVLRKVETLNALTSSNRALRQERDNFIIQVNDLLARTVKLEAELIPLQEINIELKRKAEDRQIENIALKAECSRWRQQANIAIGTPNKISPEDWEKLQKERDNLSKQLTIETSNIVKLNSEIFSLKQDKTKLEKQEHYMDQLQQTNKDLIEQFNQQVSDMRKEIENHKQEIERINKSGIEKLERYKMLFKNARDGIVTLVKHNKELREEMKNQDRPGESGDSSNGELLAKIESLLTEKDEMIVKYLQEKEMLTSEIDVLTQKVTELKRQLRQIQVSNPSKKSSRTEQFMTDAPNANIKPMAGRSTNTETESSIKPSGNARVSSLASIRPISPPLRTVAVHPTNQCPIAVMVPFQQQCNIEALSSSPPISHTDHVPATSLASAILGSSEVAVPSSQDEAEVSSVQLHIALQQVILPRVEPAIAGSSSSTGSTQEQGISNSSNIVKTFQTGHKRQRDSDGEGCHTYEQAKTSQESKNPRLQVVGNEKQKSEVSVESGIKHAEVLDQVETLNAITNSNSALRQERDNLAIQVDDLRNRAVKLEAELIPLQEVRIELNRKAEDMQIENISLRAECDKWKQQAHILMERSSRTSPEKWGKLQNERDYLNKQLTIEKSNIAKLNDEIVELKQDKAKLEKQNQSMDQLIEQLHQQISDIREESETLKQEIEIINKSGIEKLERYKLLFRNAKDGIFTLLQHNKELREELQNQDRSGESGHSSIGEIMTKIESLLTEKDEMIAKHLQEKEMLSSEIDFITQKVAKLQRQLKQQQGFNSSTSSRTTESFATEPSIAYIKSMAQTQSPIEPWRNAVEPSLASIRPISPQLRTVPPISQGPIADLILSQQASSHTDHVSATSLVPVMLGTTQTAVPSQYSQDFEEVSSVQINTDLQQLVSPLIEPATDGSSRSTRPTQVKDASSGSESVRTSQTRHKRQRDSDGEGCHEYDQAKASRGSKITKLQVVETTDNKTKYL